MPIWREGLRISVWILDMQLRQCTVDDATHVREVGVDECTRVSTQ